MAPAMRLTPGEPDGGKETKQRRLDVLAGQMKSARSSFESHWKELNDFFKPRRLRLQPSDRNKGDKRNQKLVDSSPAFAARTFQSGMTSGITSSARTWFKMTLADRERLEENAAKVWLEDVRERMSAVLLRSNFYAVIPVFFGDLGVFGTAAMIAEEDDEMVVRFTHFAVGEYYLGLDGKQRVRVFMREFELTVRQVVEQFAERDGAGYSTKNLSTAVQSAWNAGQTESPVQIRHIIYANAEHEPNRLESKYKAYASCYYEMAGRNDQFLHEGGYDEWPIMATRWEVNTGDVYGTDCPGMMALPDNKELQFAKKLAAGAINKAVNPPMIGPVSMKNNPISILPGGMTWGDEVSDKKIRPLLDTSAFRLDWLTQWINDLRQLLKRAFYEDLFLLISQIDRGDVTATEILEKKEEKLLALGPALEQVNGGLDTMFDRLYGIMLRRGLIPEPPPEMDGVEFHPEYESIMAQAQRAQGRGGIETFAMFVGNAAKVDPTVLDRVDVDEMVRRYAEASGVPPKFIRADEAVAAIRSARAQAQAQQAQVEQAEQMAGAANKLAGSDTSGQNALTDLMSAGREALGGAQGGI